jgi:putative Mg2+ transporter-C (MgtC) family protein
MNWADWGMVTAQLLIATICGGIIGYQRETLERPAGFRTHVLVCVGSAIYMLVSALVAGDRYDPGRIAAQVASGIGFLGAGTIIKQGSVVRGLTTAASLWAVAGIGMAAGYGKAGLPVAVLGTVVVYLALGFLKNLERFMERTHAARITLTLLDPDSKIEWVRDTLETHGLELREFAAEDARDGERDGTNTLDVRAPSPDDIGHAVSALAQGKGVRGVRWGPVR